MKQLSLSLILIILILLQIKLSFAQNVMGDGFYDDRHVDISSACTLVTDANYYQDTFTQCNEAEQLSFSFYGQEFAIFAGRGASGGDVEICIDGDCSIASTYSASNVYGEWVRFYGLSAGSHDITLTPLFGGVLYFDALYVAFVEPVDSIRQINVNVSIAEVTPEATPEITPEATPEISHESFQFVDSSGNERTAYLNYEVSVGDAFNGSILVVLSLLILFLILVILWKK